MMKPFACLPAPHLKRLLSQSLLAGIAASIGLFAGLAPSQPGSLPSLAIGSAAYAQNTITAGEIENYAQSVLEIEPIRQRAYDRIKEITGSEVPPIACHRPNSLNNLSRNIREIAVEYCNQSIQIVESHNLTISRFNTITTTLQADANLASQIQATLIRLQQQQAIPR